MDTPRRPTIANLDMAGGDSQAWQRACVALADAYPRYQVWRGRGEERRATGIPDYYHILGAALKCGCALVTGENYRIVLAAVGERAQALEKGEPEHIERISSTMQPTPTQLDPSFVIQE